MSTDRARLFGNDLRLVPYTGDWDLTADGAGDLDLAVGTTNIAQALVLRLQVRRGELAPLGWPDYGSRLHELIGEPNIARTHVKIMAFAREAVAADPRVAEVHDVTTRLLPGERTTVRIEMEIWLI